MSSDTSSARGEIVIFDRGWYNKLASARHGLRQGRASHVFLSSTQVGGTLSTAGFADQDLVEVGMEEQERRFAASTIRCGNGSSAPWMWIMPLARLFAGDARCSRPPTANALDHRADRRQAAGVNCISHILNVIPYKKIHKPKVKLPKRSAKSGYDDQVSLKNRKFAVERF